MEADRRGLEDYFPFGEPLCPLPGLLMGGYQLLPALAQAAVSHKTLDKRRTDACCTAILASADLLHLRPHGKSVVSICGPGLSLLPPTPHRCNGSLSTEPGDTCPWHRVLRSHNLPSFTKHPKMGGRGCGWNLLVSKCS